MESSLAITKYNAVDIVYSNALQLPPILEFCFVLFFYDNQNLYTIIVMYRFWNLRLKILVKCQVTGKNNIVHSNIISSKQLHVRN